MPACDDCGCVLIHSSAGIPAEKTAFDHLADSCVDADQAQRSVPEPRAPVLSEQLNNPSTDGFPKEAESSRQEQDSKLSSHVPAQGSGSHRFGLVHSCENPRSRPAAIACTPTAPRCGLRSPSLQPDLVLSLCRSKPFRRYRCGPMGWSF